MTLDHKTSLKCQFCEIAIYTIWKLNKWVFHLMYGLLGLDNIWPRYNYLKIWNLRVLKNLHIEKIAFKNVQMKFFAKHITNQTFIFDIYDRKCTKYLHGTWSLLNILMILGIKKSIIIYNYPYSVFLAIATNIPQRLKTGFVVQGHI